MSLEEIINNECEHNFLIIDSYITCTKCGYCSENKIISYQAERVYDNKEDKEHTSPLRAITGELTVFNESERGVTLYNKIILHRAKKYIDKPQKERINAEINNQIRKIRYYLTETVTESSKRIFRKLVDNKLAKRKDYHKLLATSIYLAGINEGAPKLKSEVEEIYKKIDDEITTVDIDRTLKVIIEFGLDTKLGLKTQRVSISTCTQDYCEKMGLPRRITNQVNELIEYLMDDKAQNKMRLIMKHYNKIINNKIELKTITYPELMKEYLINLPADTKEKLIKNPTIIGLNEIGIIGSAVYHTIKNNELTQEELSHIKKQIMINDKQTISQRAIANYLNITEVTIRHNLRLIELYVAL